MRSLIDKMTGPALSLPDHFGSPRARARVREESERGDDDWLPNLRNGRLKRRSKWGKKSMQGRMGEESVNLGMRK